MAAPLIPPPPDYQPTLEDRKTEIPPPPDTQVPPQGQKPVLGQPGPAQSPLAQAQERMQNPFGKRLGAINIPGLGHPFQPGNAPPSLAPGLGGAKLLPGMIGQGVAGAGEALASGRGPLAALKEGAMGAAGAGALGGLAHLGLGLPAKAAAAKKAMGEFGNVLKGRELTAGVNKEMTGALNTLEKQAFEKARATHAEDAAKKVAAELKKNVPALAPFAADSKGLVDMIYGKGKAAVSRAFDKALKEVVANGKGKTVQVSADAAEALGVVGTGGGNLPLSRVAREALEKAGKLPPQGMVTVDAGELANAALGTWRKDPRSYRAAMDALDKANIGDPAARAAYKHYVGLSQFVDKTGALKGEVFNPEAFNAGMTKLKQVEEMRRRGIGSATEGYGGLARGGPLAPTPRQVPIQGPEPSGPAGIKTRKNPLAGHPFALGGAGEALSYGLTGSHGFGIPFVGGMALSNAMPKELVTQAPGVNPAVQALIDAITRGGGLAGSRIAQ